MDDKAFELLLCFSILPPFAIVFLPLSISLYIKTKRSIKRPRNLNASVDLFIFQYYLELLKHNTYSLDVQDVR